MGGLLLAVWFTDAMLSLRAELLPRQGEIGLHLRVLLFTGVAALGVALAAGIAPFLDSRRRSDGGSALTRALGSRGGRVDGLRRSAPVVAQIALTTVLLFGAGLLLRSLSEMVDLARGFERDGVVILQTRLPQERYPDHAAKTAVAEVLTVSAASGWRGFESDAKGIRLRDGEVQLLEADYATGGVLHQHHIVAGFLTNVLARRLHEPDRQRTALPVMKNFQFGHIRVPSLGIVDMISSLRSRVRLWRRRLRRPPARIRAIRRRARSQGLSVSTSLHA